MVITSARLQNYRLYKDSSFDFEPGVNIIVGPNASGKTNLLDAIFYCCTGSPLIKPKEHIVRNDGSWARADCLTSDNQKRTVKIKESIEVIINGKIYKRLPQKERIPTVVFEPKHLFQITTSSEMRRAYIDDILSSINQEFISTRSQYLKTLKQRNSLLKSGHSSVNKQIFAWDIRLTELAGKYVEQRLEIIKKINTQTSKIYSAIAAAKQELQVKYDTKLTINNYADKMLSSLQKNIDLDLIRGFTGVGPHRDDIRLVLDGNDIRERASRGETRSTILALKIVEASILEESLGARPILLLDDVFGELDGSRRETLTRFIKDKQVFITTTDADIVTHNFINGTNIITF